MNIPIIPVLAGLATCVIIAISFVFHQRFAPAVLLFGIVCAIWLVVLCTANNMFLDNIISIYIVIGLAVVCTTAGIAGILLRLFLKWIHHYRDHKRGVGDDGCL